MNVWNVKEHGLGRKTYQLTTTQMKTTQNECFGYTRVSTVKQGEGVSLEAQKEAIQAFADRNDLIITQWFEERETAAKSGRPIFNTMIKQLRLRKASGVIIHKIDRSARNFSDWAKIGDLSDSGIDVHFTTESLDFKSRGGRLTADIQAVIAADYIRNLRQETIKGIDGRLKQGLYPFKAPIGYLDNGGGKAKTIDPVNGPLVRRLFELYASGEHSLWSLVDQSRSMGIRNTKGTLIGKTCIENMLANPFYIGLMYLSRTNRTYKGIHEPLISHSLFKQVADVRSGKWVKKITKHQFTFRRVFKCKACNTAVIGERQKGHVYYRCHTKQCSPGTLKEEQIEQLVLSSLENFVLPECARIQLDQNFDHVAQTLIKKNTQNTQSMQLAQLEERKSRLVDALVDGLISKDVYEERNSKLIFQISELREKSENSMKPEAIADHLSKTRELFKSLYSTYFFAKPDEKRQMLKILYANRVTEGTKLYIEPRNWLIEVSETLGFRSGALDRSTKRKGNDMPEGAIAGFIELWERPELQTLLLIQAQVTGRTADPCASLDG